MRNSHAYSCKHLKASHSPHADRFSDRSFDLALACDLIRLAGASGHAWITVALYSMVGGFISALCAAVPGLIDLLYYKGGTRPVKKSALTHMTINPIVVTLYAINIWLRAGERGVKGARMSTPVLLSLIGVALLFVSGWLGGQMVHVYGVGGGRPGIAAVHVVSCKISEYPHPPHPCKRRLC
jgi:uncharacterized membrane protein